ncbi:hypothetical protein ACNKH9_24310, partial [Metapseudomonas otitidis]|uniref:hypothetical protein n=1 Tax=Metapseudomonas otitidis TaxID=319939 RepID=UPI003A8C2896
ACAGGLKRNATRPTLRRSAFAAGCTGVGANSLVLSALAVVNLRKPLHTDREAHIDEDFGEDVGAAKRPFQEAERNRRETQ